MIYLKISDTQYEVCEPVSDVCTIHDSGYNRTDKKEEEKKSPPKPTACTTVLQQRDEVTLKNGKKVPILQPYKFCAEGDTYVDAQKSAEVQAKNFLDGIEAEKAAKTRGLEEELKRSQRKQPGEL